MSAIQMRPTFSLATELSGEEAFRRIRDTFSKRTDGHSDCGFQGQFVNDHAMVSVEESSRHFWSPWMHLDIRETEQARLVVGRFSPHPSIWTAIMFSFFAIAVLIFFAAMFGVSQQLSGQAPWAYCFIPVGLLVIALLWFVSKTGQRLAQVEMKQMHRCLEECLSE